MPERNVFACAIVLMPASDANADCKESVLSNQNSTIPSMGGSS